MVALNCQLDRIWRSSLCDLSLPERIHLGWESYPHWPQCLIEGSYAKNPEGKAVRLPYPHFFLRCAHFCYPIRLPLPSSDDPGTFQAPGTGLRLRSSCWGPWLSGVCTGIVGTGQPLLLKPIQCTSLKVLLPCASREPQCTSAKGSRIWHMHLEVTQAFRP